MRRNVNKYLFDVRRFLDLTIEIMGTSTEAEYLANSHQQAAVERGLHLIGEALHQMRKDFPDEVNSIPDAVRAIGLRHVLAHDYLNLDQSILWLTVMQDLAPLRDAVEAKLAGVDIPTETDPWVS